MPKVNTYVYVVKDGYPVLLSPGDDIPEGVEVTNPAVLEDSDSDGYEGNQEVEPEVTAEDLLSNDSPADEDSEADAEQPETPEQTAPAKRASRKAAPASE